MTPALPQHYVSVAGVVLDAAGRILLIRRRDNGEWQIPGGVLEPAESIPAGVLREIEEETGVLVRVGDLTGVYKNVARGVVSLVYRCEPVGGATRVSDESSAVEWMSVDEARARITEVFRVRVDDALSGGVATRLHDGVRMLD